MKTFHIFLIFICLFVYTYAVRGQQIQGGLNYILQAPPKTEDAKSLYTYLNTLYNRWNTLQVTIQEPNGNIDANYGNIIVYFDGTDYWLAVETTSPQGNAWKGIKLGAV